MRLAWSKLAQLELEALRRYSVRNWGDAVAHRYLADIRDAAKAVAADPQLARQLRGALRIRRVRSHYLIVHVDAAAGRVMIARVLHEAMDIERHLPID